MSGVESLADPPAALLTVVAVVTLVAVTANRPTEN
jgi:hypothetical protein